ncbi:PepSY domain-containing protein [Streptomyces sp. NPDC006798]|uniref:PepSY domain-containing protein n=1 Tax=Streptomyces sp. NPDC006798 TaxID=3155462 RepID=UPI0033DFABF1
MHPPLTSAAQSTEVSRIPDEPGSPGGARPFRGRIGAVVCAVALALPVVTGCGSDDGDAVVSAAEATRSPSGRPSGEASLSPERAQRQALVRSAKIGWSEAAKTAVGEVPESELVELDLGRTLRGTPSPGAVTASPSATPAPGSPQWTATVALRDGTAHRVTIDAVTGEVRRSEAEKDQDAGDKQELADLLSRATRTPRQAVDTAAEKYPGTVTGLQLDTEDSGDDNGDDGDATGGVPVVVWETEVANTRDWTEADVTVDAVTGKVVRERVDKD